MPKFFYAVLLLLLSSYGCSRKPIQYQLNYSDYKIDSTIGIDTPIYIAMKPYRDSVHQEMGKVIGFSNKTLYKKRPQSALGSLLTQCMQAKAKEKFGLPIDAVILNYGGIRSYLPQGNITIGAVFEIMPFDNLIVIQKIKGDILQLYLNRIADKGGWPMTGIEMKIEQGKAVNVLIQGTALDINKTYTIAQTDYIAKGGDNCDMLINIPYIDKGIILRNALIECFSEKTKAGYSID